MGDSDDEYDRGRRDKFRRERAGPGSGGPPPRSRDDWAGGDRWVMLLLLSR